MKIRLTPNSQEKITCLIREHADVVRINKEAEVVLETTEEALLTSECDLIDFITEKINAAFDIGQRGGWAE